MVSPGRGSFDRFDRPGCDVGSRQNELELEESACHAREEDGLLGGCGRFVKINSKVCI